MGRRPTMSSTALTMSKYQFWEGMASRAPPIMANRTSQSTLKAYTELQNWNSTQPGPSLDLICTISGWRILSWLRWRSIPPIWYIISCFRGSWIRALRAPLSSSHAGISIWLLPTGLSLFRSSTKLVPSRWLESNRMITAISSWSRIREPLSRPSFECKLISTTKKATYSRSLMPCSPFST